MIKLNFIINNCYVTDHLKLSADLKEYKTIMWDIGEQTKMSLKKLIENNQEYDIKIIIEDVGNENG